MRDLAVLFLHLLATVARLAGPGGLLSVRTRRGFSTIGVTGGLRPRDVRCGVFVVHSTEAD